MSDTKEYIIDQAYKLFLNKSYEAVSISDISKAIGLTKGALYHHFLNKEELFKAVIDKYLSAITMSEIREEMTMAEFIEFNVGHVRQIITTVCVDDLPFVPVQYLSLLIDAMRHYPGYDQKNEEYFNQEILKLEAILTRAVRQGEIRENVDIHVAALNFFSISVGIAANLFRQHSPDQAIETFHTQMYELYKLLKK